MNTRRKLFFLSGKGGSPAPGQSLFDAYKTRVEDDSGAVISDAETLDFFNKSIQNNLRDNLVFHANARAGNRLTLPALENINKTYSLDGNGNDFTQTSGAIQPTLGAKGWVFDGVGTRLFGGNPASLQTSGDKTIMAWAKANTITPSFQTIFGAGILAGSTAGIGVLLTDNGFAAQARETSNNTFPQLSYSDLDAPDPMEYFHISCVRRGNITELHLNGALVAQSTPIVLDTTPSKAFFVGGARDDGSFAPFDGIINDTRAYNTALLVSEIAQIYNQTRSFYGV